MFSAVSSQSSPQRIPGQWRRPRRHHTLQPLLAFAETAKPGSFAAAARELACTPSTLAKATSRLEKQLGVRLFHRTTRRVGLTEDGERLFERCRRVLAELDLLQEEASGARSAPSGTLRIDMPVSLGRIVMLRLLAHLAREHPALSIDARFSDAYIDIVKEGVDVAIRWGALRDSSLVARQLATQQLLLFAGPSYLERAGCPRSLSDLDHHTAVVFRLPSTGRERPWNFRARGRKVNYIPKSRIRATSASETLRLLSALDWNARGHGGYTHRTRARIKPATSLWERTRGHVIEPALFSELRDE